MAPYEALMVIAAKDFGCLPRDVEERLTDTEFHVWLELREQEAREIKNAR